MISMFADIISQVRSSFSRSFLSFPSLLPDFYKLCLRRGSGWHALKTLLDGKQTFEIWLCFFCKISHWWWQIKLAGVCRTEGALRHQLTKIRYEIHLFCFVASVIRRYDNMECLLSGHISFKDECFHMELNPLGTKAESHCSENVLDFLVLLTNLSVQSHRHWFQMEWAADIVLMER